MSAAVNIIAIFVPIVFLIGLFVSISLGVYFKYKTNVTMYERVPPEALGEWNSTNAQTKVQMRAMRGRNTGLRIGGLLIGLGFGTAIGCTLLACGAFEPLAKYSEYDQYAVVTFMIISLSMLCGGGGMVAAYFLERRLDGNVKSK
jgi:hypothetical protein